jgi:alpha-maltose-1-phosphate synthase
VVRALFINSGILGQVAFARFISHAFAEEFEGIRARQVVITDHLTVAERLRRRILCMRLWPDGLGGMRNLDRHRFRAELNAGLVARDRIAREEAREPIDVLHFHRQATAYASLDRMRRTPAIVSIDCTQRCVVEVAKNELEAQSYLPNVRRDGEIFKAAKLIISTSEWAAKSLRDEYPSCTTEVTVMPTPVHLDAFDPAWPVERFARARASARPRVLFVGGDFPRKGGYTLLDAWRDGRFGERASLDLVTNWPLDKSALSEGVTVHRGVNAYTPTWSGLWKDADLFVMPTRDEAFGNVFQEAGAAGLPAIGTSIHAVPEQIVDGETGVLIEPDNRAQLANALNVLLASAERRREMGLAARQRVERRADPENYRRGLAAAIHRVRES